ncbi:MAG TPA: SusC/RagA family TonB-linked outer membrane protein [Cyclobacteriaceae bacterium]|nr:SusC/RagA family TonB-linked outer membrane protein [Cyclobacteriaceae bacterium]
MQFYPLRHHASDPYFVGRRTLTLPRFRLKVLRYSALCCFFLFVVATAEAVSQNVTINERNAPLEKIFREIKRQTGYVFFYNQEFLRKARNVTVQLRDAPLTDALDQCLKGQPLSYVIENKSIIITEKPAAPERRSREPQAAPADSIGVRGNVTDETGSSVPGVNVVIRGTTHGVITDQDGNYYLQNVPDDAILVFSFVGKKSQEIPVAGRSVINVTLEEEASALEEIVVIGYGSLQKRDLTGAIAQIDPSEMQEKLTPSVNDLLRNNLAGLYIPFSVDPKGSVNMNNVRIRGTNSLLASNTPLIIVDDMIYYGDLANINPGDIERIDVMKDASSAAIYGSRAANGVIIISTKKGKSGSPEINFTVNTGIATPSFLRPVYDPESYLDMHATYSATNLPRNEPGFYSRPDNLPPGVSLEDWMAYTGATGDPTNVWLARIGLFQTEIDNYNAGRTIDWEDIVFQTGIRQDYQMSINGGTDRFKYYMSGNYTDNEGFIVGQEYQSFRARVNLESKVADFLTVGLNSQFANRDESSVPADWQAYVWGSPYGSMYEDDGETLKYLTYDYNLSRNPLYDREYRNRFRKFNDLDSRLYAIVDLPFDFKYQINFVNNVRSSRFYEHLSSQSAAIANGGEAIRANSTAYTWIIDNILSWNKSFGGHDFGLTLLANAERGRTWSDEMFNSGFFPTDILGYHAIDLGLSPRIASDDQTYTRDALLGRLNYSYMSRYYLTLALRRDGYSAFGQSNPHAYFPTVAAAWTISEENFFKSEPVDFLKLRLSWGANGNSSIGTYSALAVMESRKFLYSVGGVATPTSELRLARMANNALQWEKTTALNVGIDFGLFNSNITGSLELYDSKTTGLLVDRKLPSVTGYGAVAANLGEINNKGIELTISSVNLQTGSGLTWTSTFNMARNKNTIVSLYGDMVDVLDEGGNVIGQEEASDPTNGWFIGESIDVIWDYASDGIWQEEEEAEAYAYGGFFPGQFKNVDVNGDGVYDSEDRQFIGHTTPQFRWNLSNEFKFRNLALSFSVYGQHGHKMNFGDHAGTALYETGNGFVMPYWTPENRSNKYPSMRGNGGTNYRSLSFVRLNDITLGYTFSREILDRVKMRSLKVYASVYNVHVWTAWPGWDPENWDPSNANPQNTVGPAPRYFNLGVNIGL